MTTLQLLPWAEFSTSYRVAPSETQNPNFRHTGVLWVEPTSGDDGTHHGVSAWAFGRQLDPIHVASSSVCDEVLATLREVIPGQL